MTDMTTICDDLTAEQAELDGVLARLDDSGWDTPTPAEGWMIRDQISHLAHFDGIATTAAADPEHFRRERDEALADLDAFIAHPTAIGRSMPAGELLPWWRESRATMVEAFRRLDTSTRVPWFGPDMSAASFATARLMEAWAHGQDVVDSLGIQRTPTSRLHHVAHLGVRALPNSFRSRGLEVPADPVCVELTSPSGERWVWGEPGARNIVRGSALDFCLVVTQRRHRSDTDVVTDGPVAEAWMSIAQAYAGPPGAGRRAGQFRREEP